MKFGLTQRQLGDALGRTATCVSYWENDRREPSLADLARLAKSLEISTDWLVLGERSGKLRGHLEIAPAPVVAGRGRGTEGVTSMQDEITSVRLAWLGYKDERLVAIELSSFHAAETVAEWESRGYRVEQVSNLEALARWRREVQEASA